MEELAEQHLHYGVRPDTHVDILKLIALVFPSCHPYPVVESYALTGRHTYVPMAITAGCALVLLVSLVFLFNSLAPTRKREDNVVVNASSKLWTLHDDVSNEYYVVKETIL